MQLDPFPLEASRIEVAGWRRRIPGRWDFGDTGAEGTMPIDRLRAFLEDNHVKFATIPHAQVFTAQETAEEAHVPGKEMAKTVVVKIDDGYALAVLPASDHVSTERLRRATGARAVEIASEDEISGLFPGCEVGAMPPFGNLWGLRVFVDERLREDEQIAFNAGTHTEVVRLAYGDYERLVEPVVAKLSTRH